jgi:signal transduction histidine kinase
MEKMIFIICIIVIFILILIILYSNKKIKLIKVILDDIVEGNINRKVMLYNSSKNIAGLVNNINQITDNMCELEAQKTKQKNMISRMISNISHDLKTPLTSLVGYIELIKESDNLSKEELKEYLDVIHNKALYLNRTLENFFYMSRLESMDEKLNIEQVNLTDIIQEQIVFFYNDFKNQGITPAIEMPEEDIYVYADKVSVNRILNNLLSNSLKYGKDGNTVGLSISQDDRFVYVEVWDNGKGISEKDLEHVFERLYTAEESRSAALRGTGIGLSVVKQLVKINKGSISVESIAFKRTSFKFSLPKC